MFDSIIIGGGHNGLVCATYLAKAGQKVVLLEAGDQVGGLAKKREFAQGFNAPVANYVQHFSDQVVKDLGLSKYGYANQGADSPLIAVGSDGQSISVLGDDLEGASDSDQAAYKTLRRSLKKYAKALNSSWNTAIPKVGDNSLREIGVFAKMGLNIRLMGKEDMQEFLRVFSLPMRDLMDENFESPLLKAALSWDGLQGARLAPRSPNSAVLALLLKMSSSTEGGVSLGSSQLISALTQAAIDAGVTIKTNTRVEQVLVSADESTVVATGVKLTDGEHINARRVVSGVDPKSTFMKLVPADYQEIEFIGRIDRFRSKGLVGKLNIALKSTPKFSADVADNGRLILADKMDDIEFAFDDTKYDLPSEHPVLEVTIPSSVDSNVAPAGKALLQANVMYLPQHIEGGWSEQAKLAYVQKLIAVLEKYAPGIGELVEAAELLTPDDLEKEYGVTGGHWHHGEFAADQILMMRPTYGAAQYNSPIENLHLCSAGCHPGGGLMGAAGRNAAKEILR